MSHKKLYWSDDEFINVVNRSKNISEVLSYFGLDTQQYHYRKRFYYDVNRLKLDLSRMGEFYVNMATNPNDGKAIKSNYKTKKSLIKRGILPNYCNICSINSWLGKPVILELDHIDGNRRNNDLSNLRLLCPNCHSQTTTYCGRNKKYKCKKPIFSCIRCNKTLRAKNKTNYCFSCYKETITRTKKIVWPQLEVLLSELKTKTFVSLAKELGVSDNAIRKHIKRELDKIGGNYGN